MESNENGCGGDAPREWNQIAIRDIDPRVRLELAKQRPGLAADTNAREEVRTDLNCGVHVARCAPQRGENVVGLVTCDNARRLCVGVLVLIGLVGQHEFGRRLRADACVRCQSADRL